VKLRIRQSFLTCAFLNLMVPGMGHAFLREYLFGLFIFLIMLIAVALFLVSFLVHLPTIAYILLFGLPVLFFLFTFVDLYRTLQRRRSQIKPGNSRLILFVAIAIAFQLAAPASPLHFILRNRPEVFRATDNNLSPLFSNGDLLKANPLAYAVDLFFFDKPVFHSLPDRFDVIRFSENDGPPKLGLVIGLPGENVEVLEGVVAVDGFPQPEPINAGIILSGDCPLTSVERSSILVTTVYLGRIERVVQIPLAGIRGKVDHLL